MSKQPNILIILTDDMGACDLGFYGNLLAETPNLDQLAKKSCRHEAFYVTPVCAPTRAALLTGRHHLRCGVAGVHGGKDHVHLSETLLPQYLKQAGYATGIWGKWHSGMSEGYQPHQRGFEEALLLRLYKHRDPVSTLNGGKKTNHPGRWGDEVIVDATIAFAEKHQKQPFFGMVSSMTPHGPLDAPEAEIEARIAKGMSRNLATLHAQMTLLDRELGRLISALEEMDFQGRETRILFLSDNGPAMIENKFTDEERALRNHLNRRGWKGDVWEGGIRTPLFLHTLGQNESSEVDQPADVTDLLPTLCRWAGVEPNRDKPLDGRDITSIFQGETLSEKRIFQWVHPSTPPYPGREEVRVLENEYRPVSPEEKPLLPLSEQVVSLRDGDWKLTLNADLNRQGGDMRFFGNLREDPLEQTNHPEHPAAADFDHQLEKWWQGILEDPNAFAQPEILVPANGGCAFRATTTAGLSESLRNDVAAVFGFHTAGQTLHWNLQAAACRTVMPELQWLGEKTPQTGTVLTFECSGARSMGTVQADGQISWDHPLEVDAGPNTLTLTLQNDLQENLALCQITFQSIA